MLLPAGRSSCKRLQLLHRRRSRGPTFSTSPGQLLPARGAYQMDLANGSTFGRGTMTFGGLSFIFYIVDSTRFKLMENDGQFATFGDALQQSGTVATQNSGFKGDFTFLIGGGAVLGGPIARAAAFTADGAGNLGAI